MKYIIKDKQMRLYVKKASHGYLNWTNKIEDAKRWSRQRTATGKIIVYNIKNAEVVPVGEVVTIMNGHNHGQVVHEPRLEQED